MDVKKLIRFHVLLNHNPMAMFDGYKETDQLMVGPDGYLQTVEESTPAEEADRLFDHFNKNKSSSVGRFLTVGDVVVIDDDVIVRENHDLWKMADWRLKDAVLKLLTGVKDAASIH